MTFHIRVATPRDIGAIDTLLQRSYPRLLRADYPPSVLVSALPRIVQAQPALITSGSYYVAEGASGALLGAGGWTFARPGGGAPQSAGRANVRHVVTDDRALRRGVGRAIMDHSLKRAHAAGATWMHCMSTRTAVPFYEACGFKVIGPIVIPLAPGVDFPAVEMHRSL